MSEELENWERPAIDSVPFVTLFGQRIAEIVSGKIRLTRYALEYDWKPAQLRAIADFCESREKEGKDGF